MRAMLIAALALWAPALASPATRCGGGRFLVERALLGDGDRTATVDAVVLDGGQVSIASGCPPVRARTKASRKGTTLKAAWTSCGDARGVRLKARIDRTCARMAGVIAVRTTDSRRRFTAARVPTCGNGVREADEQCDDANTADGDCCSAACRNEDGADCAPKGCARNADCAADGYCEMPAGECDGAGLCRQLPAACIGVLEPACGCDDRTYVNACEAARAGVSLRSTGRCGRRCGTIAGLACADGKFCEHPPGECEGADQEGMCVPVSEACPQVYRPVCGCDGRTYGNDCERRGAKAQKAHDGPCACRPIQCEPGTEPRDTDGDGCPDTCGVGDVCGSNRDCAVHAYCAAEPGQCDGRGLCMARPEGCPRLWDPVCGCDGQTYGSACVAAAAGIRVSRRGECLCPLILCAPGTRPVDRDGDGCIESCLTPCRQTCDCYLDPTLEFPRACPIDCAPCGNFWVCEDGFCQDRCGLIPPGQAQCSGCETNADCTEQEFCAKQPGECGARGACQPRGDACPAVQEPVCGCDGRTYANACEAGRAGVSVAARGSCPQVCGTIVGIPCPDGQFCELPPEMCGGADLAGRCVEVSRVCPEFYQPVCGCDGQTYGNDCERRGAKAQKAHDGPCRPVACKDPCDCQSLPFDQPCPLLCPSCGSYWVCEAGRCIERCGPISFGRADCTLR